MPLPQRFQKPPAGSRHFFHAAIERRLIGLGRLVKPADLAHELQRRRVQFLPRNRLPCPPQNFDATAHLPLPYLSGCTDRRVRPTWQAFPQSMPAKRRLSESQAAARDTSERIPFAASDTAAPCPMPPQIARLAPLPAPRRRSRDCRKPPSRAPAWCASPRHTPQFTSTTTKAAARAR